LLASVVIVGLLLTWFFFFGQGRRFFEQRVAETAPAAKSIAVLPFENISANSYRQARHAQQ
jgi:TolB-like protein